MSFNTTRMYRVVDVSRQNNSGLYIFLFSLLTFFGTGTGVSGQEIMTAPRFFDLVAEQYAGIIDYTADVSIKSPEETLKGRMYHKSPNLIRIDFEDPKDQVLVSDGETLKIYIPRFNVTLQQELHERTTEVHAGIAGARGLSLLRRNYSIAYQDSPHPAPLEEGSDEMVTKLRLDWRTTSEGYRQLILSIDENYMIRRIVGVTVRYEEIIFDFRNIETNQSIPDARFEYEPPSSANRFHNFLFGQEG
jgi:outer membrane lipoprotein-sorting protein